MHVEDRPCLVIDGGHACAARTLLKSCKEGVAASSSRPSWFNCDRHGHLRDPDDRYQILD